MDSQKINEFMHKTGANATDALSCLQTWSWDVKRAITDYNDTIEVSKEKFDSFDENSAPVQTNVEKPVILRRPTLVKSDSIDIADYRKLSRGISRATDNINLVSIARTEIAKDFIQSNNDKSNFNNLIESPDFTFILPNIFNYPEEFRCFLEKDLLECSTLSALEHSQFLNWWVEKGICQKLWPLATSGDGNCLLHAASLGMWGFHDRKLTLRSALYNTLSKGKFKDALYRRWRFQQTRYNKTAGFVYSQVEWAKEWYELVSMSSPEPRNNTKSRRRVSTNSSPSIIPSNDSIDDCAIYESLEEIHILALAHVLRRTIIVISDTVLKDLNGEAMAPITFGGIYFPFEIEAGDCNRGPLLLAYDMAHFSALVPMDMEMNNLPALIPLVTANNVFLPIQFCIDPGENFDWLNYDGSEDCWALNEREQVALLKEYLDIIYVPSSPQEELEYSEDYTDEEISKFSEAELIIPTTVSLPPEEITKAASNKATKQLQSVARSFGSIGKNMGKKIKKNIGTFTRIGTNKTNNLNNSVHCKNKNSSSIQSFTCCRVLCARLRIQRCEFQEEMIRNYLDCARNRFENSDMADLSTNQLINNCDRSQFEMSSPNLFCMTTDCKNLSRSNQSYLCSDCMDKQVQPLQLNVGQSALRYGTGKSKFYTQVDTKYHENLKNLPAARRLSDLDQTLYLSNSTFYNDQISNEDSSKHMENGGEMHLETQPCRNAGCIFYGTLTTNFYCSKCFRNSTGSTVTSPQSNTSNKIFPTSTAIIGKSNSKIMSDI